MSKNVIIGRLGRDAREIESNGKKFLSFSVAYDAYDKEAKAEITKWVDVNVNTFGTGLIQHLTKGAQIAAVGVPGTRTYTKDGEERTAETLNADRLSIGGTLFFAYDNGDNKMALVVGRLGKDAAEVQHDGKTFLGFSVATEQYNKDAKKEETVWLDATLNHYGPGLVPRLTKGVGVALIGILLPSKEEGRSQRLLINDLHFFGNKKPGGEGAMDDDPI